LTIDVADVTPAPAGSYYPHELIGARCVDRSRGDLGAIEDIADAGGGPLLIVRGRGGELLVPFVERFVVGLDRGARRLDVDLPAGLVEP
jgi:16S rRNA processing protein RimM